MLVRPTTDTRTDRIDLPTRRIGYVPGADRVAALTGVRALAALLVVGTHAAYATGKTAHGYLGLVYSRLEIGVPIFFVLSGFLLFSPWVTAAATGATPPALGSYARRRFLRVVPAYVVTVLAAYLLYQFWVPGPNPGHTWAGLLRYLTLTQIYTDNYLVTYLHQGLSQMWSLAVEAAFYAALPLLAYLLLAVQFRRRWRPMRLLAGLVVLAAVTPAWLVVMHATDLLRDSAGMWLPAHLACFAGGMALAVLRVIGVRCLAATAIPLAVVGYLIVSTPIAGDTASSVTWWQPLAKALFYAAIATLAVAPLALGGRGWYTRLLSSRVMVWLGEISYEIFLVHVIVMAVAMASVPHWQLYTGSTAALFALTMVMTIPVAWALNKVSRRVRGSPGPGSAPAPPVPVRTALSRRSG